MDSVPLLKILGQSLQHFRTWLTYCGWAVATTSTTMMARSVYVALSLLALVNRSFALFCAPPSDDIVCGDPPTCSYGLTKDICGHCDVCAKGPGEECGGLWNTAGKCGESMKCELDLGQNLNQNFGRAPSPEDIGVCVQIAVCDPACKNGDCTPPNTCTCFRGWSGDTCNEAVCDPTCINGECTTPNTCTCDEGWSGDTCNEAWRWSPETNACIAGNNDLLLYFISFDDCKAYCQYQIEFDCRSIEYHSENRRCNISEANSTSINYWQPCYIAGWTFTEVTSRLIILEAAQQLPSCDSACINGNCTAPNTCTCSKGWSGDTCNEAVCDPTCINGECTAPNTCTCDEGWSGDTCNEEWRWSPETNACIAGNNDLIFGSISLDDCKAYCQFQIEFDCRSLEYHSDNRHCVLSEATSPSINYRQPCYIKGWTFREVIGVTKILNSVLCDSACINGNCTAPNTCTCFEGWSGDTCNEAACDPTCINGECTAPNTCTCYRGWSGDTCNEEWRWSPETNACIAGNNDLVLEFISFDDCKAYCQFQIEFDCRSLEYHSDNRRCVLSEATSTSINYQQPCYIMGWTFTEVIGWTWTHETDACIVGNHNLVLESISLNDCKAHCQVENDFDCRSLEYHSNDRRCMLSESTSNSINYRQHCYTTGWTFTEVIGSY